MIDNIDRQIADSQDELGLVQEQPPSIKILHSLMNFNLASTNPKPTTASSTTKAQKSHEEPDDLELDLQMINAKAELDRLRLEGEHFRYRREQQWQKSQDNLKEKTRTLETNMKRHLKAPNSLTRQIVEQTFNDPFRNRFCLLLEVKNVQAIANMWWMHRQQVLQLDTFDDLNELLDIERSKLKEKAHKNRARMLGMLTATPFQVDHLKSHLAQDYQAEREEERLECSILNRQLLPTATTIQLDHQEAPKVPLPPPPGPPRQTANIQLVEDESHEAELNQHRLEISILKRKQLLALPSTTLQLDGELDQHRLKMSVLKRQQLTPKAPGGLPPHPAPPITTNTPKGGSTSLSPSIQARKRHRSQCCPVLRGYEKWQILRRKQPLGSLSINIAPF